jgi:hypothetical protein
MHIHIYSILRFYTVVYASETPAVHIYSILRVCTAVYASETPAVQISFRSGRGLARCTLTENLLRGASEPGRRATQLYYIHVYNPSCIFIQYSSLLGRARHGLCCDAAVGSPAMNCRNLLQGAFRSGAPRIKRLRRNRLELVSAREVVSQGI